MFSSFSFITLFFQPTLRHLAVSTLRHLIEKDPVWPWFFLIPEIKALSYHVHFSSVTFCYFFPQVSIVDEQIEDELFHMLDEETDSEYVEETVYLC